MNKNNNQEPCETFTPHSIRKLCDVCRRPFEDHTFTEEDVDNMRTYLRAFKELPEAKSHTHYAWIPPHCPDNRIDEFFKKYPEDKVPRHGSIGQKNRLKQLAYQIPLTDVSAEKCRFLDPKYQTEYANYVEELQNTFLRIGNVKEWTNGMAVQCPNCLLLLDPDELVVTTSENGGQAFHPACHVCFKCRELLADLIHCSDVNGTAFCVRHYNDEAKKRCQTCDELIFATHYALAGNKYYHKEHLLCFSCDSLLDGSKGFAKSGEIYCESCYETEFCEECAKCQKKITVESRHISFREKNWHDECFTCTKCDTMLSDIPFEIANEEMFLCSECYQKDYAPKCEGCKKCFEAQSQVVTYEEKVYHVDCFKCVDCVNSIGTGPFVPHKGRVYCKSCHLRNFGVRCFRCKYTITDDRALMYNKQPYHEDCFTCYKCTTNISSRPFKTVEENWYCLKCYASTFCQNCHLCEEAILLGTDEEIMYSYREYRWHASCFVCTVCSNSLADEPFVMKDKVLVCKPCISEMEKRVENSNEKQEAEKEKENVTSTEEGEGEEKVENLENEDGESVTKSG